MATSVVPESLLSRNPHFRNEIADMIWPSCWEEDLDVWTGHAWSYTPLCISVNATDPQLCVYTDTVFANGGGISIVAQPSMARQLTKHPMLQTPGLRVQSSGNHQKSTDQYEMQSLPGRGIGVVAKSKLERGTLLMSETPIIAFQQDTMKMPGSLGELFLLHKTAVERLPPKSRDTYMSMDDGGFVADFYGDRFESNAFNVLDYVLVFPMIARINHDCRPNIEYYFDRKSFSNQVHVLRTIQPGEEITGSYISHDMPFEKRSERLRDQWGFTCTCAACSASREAIEASDNRLKQMKQFEEELEQIKSRRTALTETAERLISLYEEENIHGPIAKAYEFAALEYSYAGHKWKAKRYAKMAVDAGRLWRGPSDPGVKRMEALLENPEIHPSWRRLSS
ncbi:SET domain-containing protein [Tothia fuscella]|uniref:SET domain-containing protein n=1 Tax=Tothia fuscella TaxID=1048955 RepID=A0A9P4TSL0_9PEZI|nr:SET domain-containing protein [Tothia fuscella]